MYNLDDKWKLYYSETDPAKRKEIFETLTGEDDSGSGEISTVAKKLYDVRYTDDGADMMIKLIMSSISVKQVVDFALKWNIKGVKKDMEKAGFKIGFEAGDTGKLCLFHEIKNGVKRYIETCRSESYGSAFSGMIKISKEEQHGRMKKELYNMTYDLMDRTKGIEVEHFREYMELFRDAAAEEFRTEFDEELSEAMKDE